MFYNMVHLNSDRLHYIGILLSDYISIVHFDLLRSTFIQNIVNPTLCFMPQMFCKT